MIYVKFGKDLFSISKVIGRKTQLNSTQLNLLRNGSPRAE